MSSLRCLDDFRYFAVDARVLEVTNKTVESVIESIIEISTAKKLFDKFRQSIKVSHRAEYNGVKKLTTSGRVAPRDLDSVQEALESEHVETETDRRLVELTRVVETA